MAWLYKQKKSSYWWLGYCHEGKQVLKSTGTADRLAAEQQLARVETLFGAARAGVLTHELFQKLTNGGLPPVTLADELAGWLAESKHQTEANTSGRYGGIAAELKDFLGVTANAPLLSAVTTSDISRYLTHKRGSTAASTCNVVRKILAGFFKRAVQNNRLRDNPVSPIRPFKAARGEKVRRRSFSLPELQSIYKQAPDDFWRYMIVGGAYTGLRMGDLITLKWGSVDLGTGFLLVRPDKTENKEVAIPIAKPFREIIVALRAAAGKVKPSEYLWPEQAEKHSRYKSKSGYFSNQFFKDILVPAGLVTARPTSHKAKKNSTGRRVTNEISFHCLRHFFISQLKSTGSNQAVAKELAGHSSDQVNRLYTHVPPEALTAAINQLPEFVGQS